MREDSKEKTDPSNLNEPTSVGTDWSFAGRMDAERIDLAFGGNWRSYSPKYSEHVTRRLNSALERSESPLAAKSIVAENDHQVRKSWTQKTDRLHNERSLKSIGFWFQTKSVFLGIGLLAGIIVTSTWNAQWLPELFSVPQHGDRTAQTYATSRGERSKTVVLPDGSTVVMNADSRLTVHGSFGETDRRVTLEGEAFFSVGAASDKPFIVHAAASTTKVLGTEFNVRSYGNSGKVEVAVLEGRVLLENTVLAAGELGSIEMANAHVVTLAQDLSRYTEWMRGNISFDDTPLPLVALQLERQFDVDIKIENKELAYQKVSGTLKSPSLSDALEYLSLMLNADFKRDGKTITFYKR